jgi:hypothetical protein
MQMNKTTRNKIKTPEDLSPYLTYSVRSAEIHNDADGGD